MSVERRQAIGFDLVGVTPAQPAPHREAYHRWLAQGYHAGMAYMARPDRVARRDDPRRILPEARSIVVVGLNYATLQPPPEQVQDPARGRIARYAWGADYHDLMLERLERLAAAIAQDLGHPIRYRAYVDTGPVLERDYAAEAGLGFIGKNTCLIHPRRGSWLFLGELLLDATLPYDRPLTGIGCGTCTRCLSACPTGAFPAPYQLDSRRCISYLTIEHKGSIPRDLRPRMGNWIFGCDLCQEVCPWNRFARPTGERAFFPPSPERIAPSLLGLITLDDEAFRHRFRNTPLWRPRRRGLLRNVAVAIGNWGDPAAVPALARALADPEPLIREHVAWALGQIGTPAARQALRDALSRESVPQVRQEIQRSLALLA
ncbi:MAG: tRNA epoxyqueuosine(34) reductase QueG [Chloroflexi bacterium]|nr:MAG: tRNA epoxyqueuosine(34) reductase QueG [Chloroflexota bacterium]